MKRVDVTGVRFGRLVAIEDAGRDGNKGRRWRCQCDCGKETVVLLYNLRNGHTTSCGCFGREMAVKAKTTHGRYDIPEFHVWYQMLRRCLVPGTQRYHRYGQRGITVCERWKESVDAFLSDMGARPGAGYSIDRIDNDGHYSCGKCEECKRNGWPMNCRWATLMEQTENKSTLRLFTIGETTQCLKRWCEQYGVNYQTVRCRLHRGWTIEQALEIDDSRLLEHAISLTIDGERKTLYEWCDIRGVRYCTALNRMRNQGMTPRQAMGIQDYADENLEASIT